jgi:hypothetical protein
LSKCAGVYFDYALSTPVFQLFFLVQVVFDQCALKQGGGKEKSKKYGASDVRGEFY